MDSILEGGAYTPLQSEVTFSGLWLLCSGTCMHPAHATHADVSDKTGTLELESQVPWGGFLTELSTYAVG